jgi:hypothetical protein
MLLLLMLHLYLYENIFCYITNIFYFFIFLRIFMIEFAFLELVKS